MLYFARSQSEATCTEDNHHRSDALIFVLNGECTEEQPEKRWHV
jgi:hypothetical protein